MNIPMPPTWFHPRGMKMTLGGVPIYHTLDGDEVLIGSKRNGRPGPTVAQLQIRRSLTQGLRYKVSWRITLSAGEDVRGELLFSEGELKEAFGLSQVIYLSKNMEQYGAESSIPGHFIRRGNFLNIPMPGTGMDGDPNISILITEEMQEAVRNLLK